MKAIIYAAVALFTAASIYGATDYFRSASIGSLKNLYAEPPAEAAVIKKDNTSNLTPVSTSSTDEKKSNLITGISQAKKKASKPRVKEKVFFKLDDFSRARIPDRIIIEPVEEIPSAVETQPATVATAMPEEENRKPEKTTVKTRRKISLDEFSRAMPVAKIKTDSLVKKPD
jgi:superfamily I DNA and/or RNA helicase